MTQANLTRALASSRSSVSIFSMISPFGLPGRSPAVPAVAGGAASRVASAAGSRACAPPGRSPAVPAVAEAPPRASRQPRVPARARLGVPDAARAQPRGPGGGGRDERGPAAVSDPRLASVTCDAKAPRSGTQTESSSPEPTSN